VFPIRHTESRTWYDAGKTTFLVTALGMKTRKVFLVLIHDCRWFGRQKDRSCGDHVGALLQGRPCHRPSKVLPQLDDWAGHGGAVDLRSQHVHRPGSHLDQTGSWPVPDDGLLAEQTWPKGKSEIEKI